MLELLDNDENNNLLLLQLLDLITEDECYSYVSENIFPTNSEIIFKWFIDNLSLSQHYGEYHFIDFQLSTGNDREDFTKSLIIVLKYTDNIELIINSIVNDFPASIMKMSVFMNLYPNLDRENYDYILHQANSSSNYDLVSFIYNVLNNQV